jgi:hypothetical protein
MRKVSAQETRELITTIAEARSYLETELWREAEASLYRLQAIENKLRGLLGEPLLPKHPCYHICPEHKKQ